MHSNEVIDNSTTAAPAHPRKLFLFAALSLADLALTWFLLERRGGGAYEQNPVLSAEDEPLVAEATVEHYALIDGAPRP